ncbi:LegC2/C7 family Dot/Icm T4SS effector [Legionella shakespearei]|uniref:Inclusion membrane protein A n=1 Tax=Legionella shakespearei DSM 23087 TaxID=1122169 RepID=A0A0W0YK26_9GAMM|nr:LegC2/C7 family Dot/Icm T4SS effector [Legionella shakespearei]KTD57237.1 inclusion membrane protein A [Legionella shakespearei DSM 23087]
MAINETELEVLIKKDAKPTTSNGNDTVTHPLQDSERHEVIEDSALTEHPENLDLASLEKITDSQKQLIKVKDKLGLIVDTIADNPSLITQAATAWGELPLWQKIAGGILLTGPTVAVGLFAHIGVLLVIGGVTGVAYTASGIVLDDHHNCNVNIAERLKEGIFSLADILQITIDALDKIRQALAQEIEKFKLENFRLQENINNLGDQVESLSTQVELFIETEKILRQNKDDLEQTSQKLQASVDEQSELLKDNQNELEKIKKAYAKSQEQLSDKVAELHGVREKMTAELEKARKVGSTLQGALQTLTGTVLEDKQHRESYEQRLKTFLNEENASFDQVAERISKTEEELAAVKDELRRTNEEYRELLARQEAQVLRLEKMEADNPGLENMKPRVNVKGLHQHGMYSKKPLNPVNVIPEAPSMVTVQ